jgi:hypothetical protein
VAGKILAINPWAINAHCVAHKNNLAIKHACEASEWASALEESVRALLSFYSNSSNRKNHLRELQLQLQLPLLNLLKLCTPRWLSRGNAMERIFHAIPAVLHQLQGEADAEVLFARLATHKFLVALMLALDVLLKMNTLSRIFQGRDLRNSAVTESVDKTIRDLEQLYLSAGGITAPHWQLFNTSVPNLGTRQHNSKYTYAGSPEIVFDRHEHATALDQAKDFARRVITGLRQYFPVNPIIQALDIFDIRAFPKTRKEWEKVRATFGNEQLELLLKHYSEMKVGHTAPLSPSEFPSIRAHWSLLKTDLFEVRNKLTANGTRPVKKAEETAAMTQFYKKVFQDNVADSAADNDRTPLCRGLRYLVCAMLVLELSSVCCERGFSCMNHIKCKARNRMYVETLDCLMMIELNGPAIQEKEAVQRLIDDAYQHWASVRSRNILKSHPGVSGRKSSCTPQMVDDVVDAIADDDAGEKADEDGLGLDDDAAKESEEAQVWENLKEAQRWMHVEAYGQHLGDDDEDDINFDDAGAADEIGTFTAAVRTTKVTQEELHARVGCYQSPQTGKHQRWVPMAPAPSFTQDELASDEGCTDLHKRKRRWIAHIFDKGWEIGRIQDEKAPPGHKYARQYQVRYPSDGSTWFHVLHPTQYGPDGSWVFVVPPPTNPRRSSRRR